MSKKYFTGISLYFLIIIEYFRALNLGQREKKNTLRRKNYLINPFIVKQSSRILNDFDQCNIALKDQKKNKKYSPSLNS